MTVVRALVLALVAVVGSFGTVAAGQREVGLGVGAVASSSGPSVLATAGFSYDLYRPGVFATQATGWYCTAASVQIMRNIARGATDHSAAAQTRYFTYMYARNWHRHPMTNGIDPPGFLAGLRAFVDNRYQLVPSTTFDNAVRSAVFRLRTSRLPVALIVDRGRHAWVLTGFTASADPAVNRAFRVLSLRVAGPLYGRQPPGGYDPPPDARLTVDAFRRYLLPFDFPFGPSPWDGRYVTFQAVS